MLDRIWQRHSVPPDEIYAKKWEHRVLIYASEELAVEAEERERRKRRRGGV